MPEQKFHEGDVVNIRPFDEIDLDDIGDLAETRTSDECYSISRRDIDSCSLQGPYMVVLEERDFDTFIYRLRSQESGESQKWYWAQGMLEFYNAEELPEPDHAGLFGLFCV